jgi:putative MATE family efflux protein
MLLSIAELAAVGLTAVAARRHGERNRSEAARAVFDAFGLALVLALIVSIGGLVTLSWLFSIMSTPEAVTTQGAGYLTVYLTGVPILFSYFVMDAAFRSAGDTRTPLHLLALAVGLNIVLDPLLILGLGPFPRLGIQGAALATILTRTLSLGIGLVWLVRRGLVQRGPMRFPEWRKMFRVGLPVAAGGAVFSAVYILLTRITSQFGTPALAALGVGHKIESLSYMACIGFGVAAATVVGQNLGAGQPERARRAGWIATGYALAATGAAALAFLLVPEWLMGVFTRDAAVIAAGSSYLRIVAIAQLFMAFELVLMMAMEGAGYTIPAMISSIGLTLLRLPLAVFLAGRIGLSGVWWSISSTAIARGIAVLGIWRWGNWRAREL